MLGYVFHNKPEEYSRNLNIIEEYINQPALYIHLMTGDPLDEVICAIKEMFKEKIIQGKNPKVRYFERDEVGDRSVKEIDLLSYINNVLADDLILVPTFIES